MQLPVIVQILKYYKIRTNYVDKHETKTINEKSRKFIQGRQLLVLTLHFAMYNHNVTFCHNWKFKSFCAKCVMKVNILNIGICTGNIQRLHCMIKHFFLCFEYITNIYSTVFLVKWLNNQHETWEFLTV